MERFGCGVVRRTPSWISPLEGMPSAQVKRSPFTPATVALASARRCIEVTRSRPVAAPFESTGLSPYRPPAGFGAVRMCIVCGPNRVNWSRFSYVTPGISSCCAPAAGDAKMPASRPKRIAFLSMDPG